MSRTIDIALTTTRATVIDVQNDALTRIGVLSPKIVKLIEVAVQGPKGDQGPAGPKGERGPPGEVEEAPIDGKEYVRCDADWKELEFPVGGGGGGSNSSGGGSVGPPGPQGPPGADSTVPGPQGPSGLPGPPGPEGPQGPQGWTGNPGPQGPPGADSTVPGPQGPAGPQGIKGDQGNPGSQGPQGVQGVAGSPGPQGPQGDPQTPSNANPLINGTAAPGTSALYTRGDHVHPTDTSRAALTQVVRYDTAQTLTAAQKSQARANIDSLKKNYILNGAMMVSQENGATAGPITAVVYYAVDMFVCSAANTTGVPQAQQVAVFTPAGSPNRLQVSTGAIDAAVAAGDIVYIDHYIEGFRAADLRFGSASAKTVTIQFGVKAPAGTYCVTLMNAAQNRSYVSEYVIAAGEANTDVVKSVVVSGDTTGTWATDNTKGIIIRWGLMAGTTYQQAAGAWGTANAVGSANQFNLMGGANTFQLFDVGLYEGAVAPAFQVPDYASELASCQRYFRKTRYGTGVAFSTTQCRVILSHPGMRASPAPSSSSGVTITDIYTGNFGQGAFSVAPVNTPDSGQYDYGAFVGLTIGRFYAVHPTVSVDILLNARL